MDSGATSKMRSSSTSMPSRPTDGLTGLQATLEKTKQGMAKISSMFKGLQEDVSSIKTAQAKTSQDISAIYERQDDADSRIMDL